MRILHVITKLDVGGAQTVVRELALEQRRRGNEVSVATGFVGGGADGLDVEGIAVHHIPSLVHRIDPAADRRAVKALLEHIETVRPDIVHAHSSKAGFLGRKAAQRSGVPCVFTAHGLPFRTGAQPHVRIASFFGELFAGRIRPAHVACVSQHDVELLTKLRMIPSHRLHLVRNGISDAVSQPGPTANRNGMRIVMVARFERQKRQDLLVEALRLLPSDFSATFVGGGSNLDQIRSEARDLGQRVTFVGESDAETYLQSADVFVLLTRWEGMAITVLEAMRAGLPVLASNVAGMDEIVQQGVTGQLVSDNPSEIADALRQMHSWGSGLAQLGRSGRQSWENSFTVETMTDSYAELYTKTLSETIFG